MNTTIENKNLNLVISEDIKIATTEEFVKNCTKKLDAIINFFHALSDFTMTHYDGYPLKIVPDDKIRQIEASRTLKKFVLSNLINNYDEIIVADPNLKLPKSKDYIKDFIPYIKVESNMSESGILSYTLVTLINTFNDVLEVRFEVSRSSSLCISIITSPICTRYSDSKKMKQIIESAEKKEICYVNTNKLISMIEDSYMASTESERQVGDKFHLFNKMRLERMDVMSGTVLNNMYLAITVYIGEINKMHDKMDDGNTYYGRINAINKQLFYQSDILDSMYDIIFKDDIDTIPVKIVFERIVHIMESIEKILTNRYYIEHIRKHQDSLVSLHNARMDFNKTIALAMRFKELHPEF